jgi:transposase|tara:strand:+ start:55 stop:336 length:282 start_codon:yes stop_codon:yes gene_type:complete
MSQRKNYTDEFRQEAVRLLQMSGKSARQMGRELGVAQSVLRRWKKQADASETVSDEDQSKGEELRQLRRENARLRMERDISKKATAFFAKESS